MDCFHVCLSQLARLGDAGQDRRRCFVLTVLELLSELVKSSHNQLVLTSRLDGRSLAHLLVSLVLALCDRLACVSRLAEVRAARADEVLFLSACLAQAVLVRTAPTHTPYKPHPTHTPYTRHGACGLTHSPLARRPCSC